MLVASAVVVQRSLRYLRARMFRLLPLVILIGCAGRIHGSPADYLPFEVNRSWVYEIEDGTGKPFELSTRVLGGDLRDLADEQKVVFQMVYGRPDDSDHDITKSIYALALAGPREFCFDAMTWKLEHEPPIVLFPVDGDAPWTGTVLLNRTGHVATARVCVDATERVKLADLTVEAVRVRTTYDGAPFAITRWFARGVGLVKMELLDGNRTYRVRLLRYGSP